MVKCGSNKKRRCKRIFQKKYGFYAASYGTEDEYSPAEVGT
jgi:hypothetical protein